LQFDVGKNFADGRIGCAGLVTCEYAFDHGAVALTHIVRTEMFDLLCAFLQGRRFGAFISERCQHQTVDPLRFKRRKKSGSQRAGGLSHEMGLLPSSFTFDDLHRRLQILRAAGNIGIAACTA